MATIHEEFELPVPAQQAWVVLRDFGAVDPIASATIVEIDAQRCRFVWTTGLLPDALAPAIAQMMEQGAQAIRSALTPRAR